MLPCPVHGNNRSCTTVPVGASSAHLSVHLSPPLFDPKVSYQAVEMMKAFHVGWKSSSMFGIDLHLIMAEPCLVRLTFRYHHGSICFHPSCQSCHYVQVSSSALQLTPSASHAAST